MTEKKKLKNSSEVNRIQKEESVSERKIERKTNPIELVNDCSRRNMKKYKKEETKESHYSYFKAGAKKKYTALALKRYKTKEKEIKQEINREDHKMRKQMDGSSMITVHKSSNISLMFSSSKTA